MQATIKGGGLLADAVKKIEPKVRKAMAQAVEQAARDAQAGPDPVDRHVGRRMVARRKELGQTQQQLGEAIGVSFQQIQKYEKASNRVSCSALAGIARAQGVTPGWYFEGLELNQAEGQSVSTAVQTASDWLLSSEALNFALEAGALNPDARRQCLGLALGGARMIKGLNDAAATLRDLAEKPKELVQ